MTDFINHFISTEKDCDADVLRLVMNFMDDATIDALLDSCYERKSDNFSYLHWRRHYRKEIDKGFHKNESVSELLAWYNDKKSMKTEYARKSLCMRFDMLSYDEQCIIIDTFMHKGYVHDMIFCCKKLLHDEFWKEDYTAIIEHFFIRTLNGNIRNAYTISKLVARHSSQKFITDCIDILDVENQSGDLLATLNVLLIASDKHPNDILKAAKLPPDDYVYVMAKKGLIVTETEAKKALDATLEREFVDNGSIKVIAWAVAKMGYLDILLEYGVKLKELKNCINEKYYE